MLHVDSPVVRCEQCGKDRSDAFMRQSEMRVGRAEGYNKGYNDGYNYILNKLIGLCQESMTLDVPLEWIRLKFPKR
jgi:hypothetical protein